jgi:Raf kinase inhibitor-like YbhB/YbcL family protein
MKKLLIGLIMIFLLSGCVVNQPESLNIPKNMKLLSQDFSHNQKLPSKFTCDGEGLSPDLNWSEFPADTKSFAVTCVDPDAPSGDFRHWLVYNLPVATTSLKAGEALKTENIAPNTGGSFDYFPPCPPASPKRQRGEPSGVHRYVFTVYALDVDQLDGVDAVNFFDKIKEHSIGSAELIGLYGR